MTKKERAIQLLERIPEEKMDYILGVLEGAAIPMTAPVKESEMTEIIMPEISLEKLTSFLGGAACASEDPLTSILDGAASASEDPEMDELCEALEKMARMELHAYATGQK